MSWKNLWKKYFRNLWINVCIKIDKKNLGALEESSQKYWKNLYLGESEKKSFGILEGTRQNPVEMFLEIHENILTEILRGTLEELLGVISGRDLQGISSIYL